MFFFLKLYSMDVASLIFGLWKGWGLGKRGAYVAHGYFFFWNRPTDTRIAKRQSLGYCMWVGLMKSLEHALNYTKKCQISYNIHTLHNLIRHFVKIIMHFLFFFLCVLKSSFANKLIQNYQRVVLPPFSIDSPNSTWHNDQEKATLLII